MNRREFLQRGIATTALGVLTAGCGGGGDSTTTATPEPPSVNGRWPMARSDPANTGATGQSGPQTEPSVTTIIDPREDDNELITPDSDYPAVAGDYVYLKQGSDAQCSSLTTGELIWHGFDAGLTNFIIIDDLFIFTSLRESDYQTAYIAAANAVTGEHIWTHDFEPDDEGDVNPHSVCADQDSVYLLSRQGDIYAFSHDGSLLWQINIEGDYCQFTTTELYSPILVTDKYLIVADITRTVYVVDKVKQKVIQRILHRETRLICDDYARTRMGGTAFADGHIFNADAIERRRPELYKIDPETGNIVWAQRFEDFYELEVPDKAVMGDGVGPAILRGPVVDDTSVYAFAKDTHCSSECDYEDKQVETFFSFSKGTGKKQWGTRIPGVSYLPVISGDVIYVVNSSDDAIAYRSFGDRNRVTALSTDTGQELWSIKLDGKIQSCPVLSGGKLFVFTSNPNNVYALS